MIGAFRRHTGDLRDVLSLEVQDVVQHLVATALQNPGEIRRQALELAERYLARHLFLRRKGSEEWTFSSSLEPFTAGVEVDFPASELRGQTNVLSVASDGQRELVLVNHSLDRLRFGVREDFGDTSRRQCQAGESLRVRRPGHDVDSFPAQLIHYRLHSRALESDARADRIDSIVARDDCDLGAAAYFACNGTDLDHLLLNLRDLQLEERLHEERIATGQNEPRTLRRLLELLEHRPNGVALVEMLAVVLLPVRNNRLRFPELVEHDDELAALDLLYFAREQLADFGGEFLPNAGSLTFTDPLDDPLLGGLNSEAPEFHKWDLFLEHIAQLEVGVLVLGLFQRNLPASILHCLDNLAQTYDAYSALQLVHAQLESDIRSELSDQRGMDTVTQQLQKIRALELFRGCQLAKRGQHFSRTSHPFTPYRRLPITAQSTTSTASRMLSNASVISDPSSRRSTTCSSSGTATISARV